MTREKTPTLTISCNEIGTCQSQPSILYMCICPSHTTNITRTPSRIPTLHMFACLHVRPRRGVYFPQRILLINTAELEEELSVLLDKNVKITKSLSLAAFRCAEDILRKQQCTYCLSNIWPLSFQWKGQKAARYVFACKCSECTPICLVTWSKSMSKLRYACILRMHESDRGWKRFHACTSTHIHIHTIINARMHTQVLLYAVRRHAAVHYFGGSHGEGDPGLDSGRSLGRARRYLQPLFAGDLHPLLLAHRSRLWLSKMLPLPLCQTNQSRAGKRTHYSIRPRVHANTIIFFISPISGVGITV